MATAKTVECSKMIQRPRTQGFVTKRAHRKSRAGCRGCKQRKIKCDESRPQCTYCKTHKVQCIYNSDIVISPNAESSDDSSVTIRSTGYSPCSLEDLSRLPNNPKSSLSVFSHWDINNMRLLHHYSTLTSGSLFVVNRDGASRIVQFEIPRLAFEHDFMMHCMLGIASLHLHHLAPDVPEHQSLTIEHRVQALSGLRAAISEFSKEKYRAILAGSLLLLILSSDLSAPATGGELWIGNWLQLWAGMREVVTLTSWTFVEQSGLAPIFARDKNPGGDLENLPSALLDMLLLMEPGTEATKFIFHALTCLSKLYQSLLLDGITPELTTKVVAWPAGTDISEFAALVKQKQPQALIIAAYYLVFTKITDEIWWLAEISSREIEAIANVLPTEYLSLMIVPLQAIHLPSKWDIASLLLSQFPGTSPSEHFTNTTSMSTSVRAKELLSVEEIE